VALIKPGEMRPRGFGGVGGDRIPAAAAGNFISASVAAVTYVSNRIPCSCGEGVGSRRVAAACPWFPQRAEGVRSSPSQYIN